jgi:hypothetical protein
MHPNFIIAKYKNMKLTGKLDEMDRLIESKEAEN